MIPVFYLLPEEIAYIIGRTGKYDDMVPVFVVVYSRMEWGGCVFGSIPVSFISFRTNG